MYGLIIHEKWLRKILDGSKTWEIRGSKTSKRGEIALIQKGSGKIYGTCELTGVIGPLSKRDLEANRGKHQVPVDELSDIISRYAKVYVWILDKINQFETPIEYHHPMGAVIWVRIGDLG
jgi:hypothetical protein